jgi:putative flavoprotein involved in K+ transport
LSWWLSAIPVGGLPFNGGCTHKTPPHDADLYQAVQAGQVTVVGEAMGLWEGGLVVRGGQKIACDQIVMATGFRRDTEWLTGFVTLDESGVPRHRGGISPEVPGLGFMGIPCMRTRRSGFLRGFVGDATSVVRSLA